MKILPDYKIDHNYNFYVSGYGSGGGFGNGFYGDGFGDGCGDYYYTWNNYPMWDVHDINLIILQ